MLPWWRMCIVKCCLLWCGVESVQIELLSESERAQWVSFVRNDDPVVEKTGLRGAPFAWFLCRCRNLVRAIASLARNGMT